MLAVDVLGEAMFDPLRSRVGVARRPIADARAGRRATAAFPALIMELRIGALWDAAAVRKFAEK